MAYYSALRALPTPDAYGPKPEWAKKQGLLALLWISLPFVLVLAAVGFLHFDDDCIRANSFADLLHVNFRPDAVAAAVLLVLLAAPFPAMFVLLAWSAWRNVANAPAACTSFAQEVRYYRSYRFLDNEGQPNFLLRLGFALAVVLASDALVAQLFQYPSGLFAEGRILRLAVLGAAGYYVYALIAFSQRYWTGNLSYRMLASFNTRVIVVLVLAGVLTLLTGGNEGVVFTGAAAFLAGIFPDSALQAVAKVAQPNLLSRFTVDPQSDLSRLPGMDLWKETSLVELGIDSVADLANSPAADVLIDVGIIPPVLLQTVDSALLLDAFSRSASAAGAAAVPDPVEGLKKLDIATASDFVLYLLGTEAYPPPYGAANPPPRPLAPTLTPENKHLRMTQVLKALGRPVGADDPDVSLRLAALRSDANVLYILDKRIRYADA